jgi:hypothetical protein
LFTFVRAELTTASGVGRFLAYFYFFKKTPGFIHQKAVGPVEILHRQIKQLVCLLLFVLQLYEKSSTS